MKPAPVRPNNPLHEWINETTSKWHYLFHSPNDAVASIARFDFVLLDNFFSSSIDIFKPRLVSRNIT